MTRPFLYLLLSQCSEGERSISNFDAFCMVMMTYCDLNYCLVAKLCLALLRPYGLQPTRLLCPWDFPGKNTGVGCHFLLQCMKVKSEREVTQSCLTLSDPMDCSPPDSSVRGIFQARVLEWGAIASPCLCFRSPI